jgi:multidrug efflux pump subunit AcrA (membrane-fusion protein)
MKLQHSLLAPALLSLLLVGAPVTVEAGAASSAVRREIVRRAELAAAERAALQAAEQQAARQAALRAAEQQAARQAAARAAQQAAARQAALRQTATAGTERQAVRSVPLDKPRDVIIQRSRHPDAAAHIEHAQKSGQPTVLHLDRAGAAARRSAATKQVNPKVKPAPGFERDEYPPAVTREGGFNSNVRFISAHDNRGAGASIRAQTKDLPDGSKVRVLVSD